MPYIGQPNANVLRFRYQVQSTDSDLDGIQIATALVRNGATFADVHGRPIDASLLQFATIDSSGILVNGSAPYVTSITRLDPNPATSGTIRFGVTFSQAVTGVTIDDFALDANGPTGAAVTSFTGSGENYVVTSSIGSGDGTLRLRVMDDDSIVDANLFQLGGVGEGNGEFAYGQGYTIRTSTATPTFNNVLTDGHMDLVLQVLPGDWYGFWYGEGWWETADTVVSAGPDAKLTRPAVPRGTFWALPQVSRFGFFRKRFLYNSVARVGAYFNNDGDFASYFESDSRVNATAPWIKLQLLDVRGPEGGDFSLYQSGITVPTVFMSSVDSIGPDDAAWVPNLDHIHYNWAFSKPGLYQVDIAASGYIDANKSGTYEPGVDPLSESQIITLHFGVELKAQDDSFTVSGNQLLRGSVTLNDQSEWGVGAATVSIESTTTKGSLSLQPNGSFAYQPSVTFDGTDSFTYRLTNPGGGFTTATVTITAQRDLNSMQC